MRLHRSEKVDHLAYYKYWCGVQGSGIIKMIRNLAQSILLRLSHFRSREHCQHKPLTALPPVRIIAHSIHYTLRTKRLYCLTVHEYSCFCLPRLNVCFY